MKLFMASVNYKNNSLSQREKLSFTSEKIEDICGNICALNDICGCVIISTCNRTEIYITSESLNENNADKILLKYSGVDDFDGFLKKKRIMRLYVILCSLPAVLNHKLLVRNKL